MEQPAATRILVISTGINWVRDEGAEVREVVKGLLAAGTSERITVTPSDGVRTYDAELDADDELVLRANGWLWSAARGIDVAHVHVALSLRHLAIAAALRLAGVPVVLSPMGMLGDDFATGSWFRGRGARYLSVKRILVRLLRRLWRLVAVSFVCVSDEERRQAHLPRSRCVLAPLPRPNSALAAAIMRRPGRDGELPPAQAPVAFVSRLDVTRKGVDRLCSWLLAHAATLPRPALLLLAPLSEAPPPVVLELQQQGLLHWDPDVRGEGVLPLLERCRGLILLSRYEGQPRILREVALLGLPVMVTASANFAEALPVVGGVLVDGDDVGAVQAGFDQLARIPGHASAARTLFDRERIGRFLAAVAAAAARGERPADVDYYRSHLLPAS